MPNCDVVSIADVVVCTVGEMRLSPGASNVIARSVEFSLDIRSEDDQTRAGAARYQLLTILNQARANTPRLTAVRASTWGSCHRRFDEGN